MRIKRFLPNALFLAGAWWALSVSFDWNGTLALRTAAHVPYAVEWCMAYVFFLVGFTLVAVSERRDV